MRASARSIALVVSLLVMTGCATPTASLKVAVHPPDNARLANAYPATIKRGSGPSLVAQLDDIVASLIERSGTSAGNTFEQCIEAYTMGRGRSVKRLVPAAPTPISSQAGAVLRVDRDVGTG